MSSYERPVYRLRPLPTGILRGTFLLPKDLVPTTRDILLESALRGIDDGGHEGIVYWVGRLDSDTTIFLSAVVPHARHGPQGVFVDEKAVGEMGRAARSLQCGVLCQVHSHPGDDSRHSDGDDDRILMPFDGMLSIVVPKFGIPFLQLANASVHQFQRNRWVLCSQESVKSNMIVLPRRIDL